MFIVIFPVNELKLLKSAAVTLVPLRVYPTVVPFATLPAVVFTVQTAVPLSFTFVAVLVSKLYVEPSRAILIFPVVSASQFSF